MSASFRPGFSVRAVLLPVHHRQKPGAGQAGACPQGTMVYRGGQDDGAPRCCHVSAICPLPGSTRPNGVRHTIWITRAGANRSCASAPLPTHISTGSVVTPATTAVRGAIRSRSPTSSSACPAVAWSPIPGAVTSIRPAVAVTAVGCVACGREPSPSPSSGRTTTTPSPTTASSSSSTPVTIRWSVTCATRRAPPGIRRILSPRPSPRPTAPTSATVSPSMVMVVSTCLSSVR